MDPHRSAALHQAQGPVRGHLQFPSTSWDLLFDAARRDGQSAAALNEFAERYYAAVRAFVAAIVREPTRADDLTQRFFETVVLSGRLLTHADRRRGSFRPYLKQAIRNFLIDEHRRRARFLESEIPVEAIAGDWNALAEQSAAPDREMLRAWARCSGWTRKSRAAGPTPRFGTSASWCGISSRATSGPAAASTTSFAR